MSAKDNGNQDTRIATTPGIKENDNYLDDVTTPRPIVNPGKRYHVVAKTRAIRRNPLHRGNLTEERFTLRRELRSSINYSMKGVINNAEQRSSQVSKQKNKSKSTRRKSAKKG